MAEMAEVWVLGGLQGLAEGLGGAGSEVVESEVAWSEIVVIEGSWSEVQRVLKVLRVLD